MDTTDYFQITKQRHWLQLDRSAVQEHCPAGWQPESDNHPWVELDGRPTMAAYSFIQDAQANGKEDSLAEVTLAVTIRKIGGDWRLYAGSWGDQDPAWPDLCDEGGIVERRKLISRLYDVDLIALGNLANSVLTVSETDASE